ncbi:CLIP domain-containing serine protease B15-like [Uranotaenia lowii]|uniref:CLIP domain-containing serine protease B15-like n=1 Tax=Uranotaenia lowii TaxID=190385 RepID=UPI0024797296|nr:CLIP domain-containing serine protease B15-like [Uranotaenia lowii]
MLKFIYLSLFTIVPVISGLEVNESCTTPYNAPGKCVPSRQCPYVIKIIRKPNSSFKDGIYLEKSKCGVMTGPRPIPLTCCPALLNPEQCGVPALANRIIGGEPTKLEEHPWAALLVFDVGGEKFAPKCGASLLNSRFVLTAAHCIVDVPKKWTLHRVRFSEVDALSEDDCATINDEDVCRQEYEIESVTVHENYDRNKMNRQHDIALIKLKEPVVFSEYVRPICVPIDDTIRALPIDDEEFTVTGWGQTETQTRSGQQLHVEIFGKTNEVCNKVYAVANITLEKTHICVGGTKNKDSCKGDSGGPLMRQFEGIWYQSGIVSFGARFCGSEGFPGIYTNVAEYIDWMTEVVNDSHVDPEMSEEE